MRTFLKDAGHEQVFLRGQPEDQIRILGLWLSSLRAGGASHNAIATYWKTDLTLAYTRGENETDDRPLAQQSPLEGRVSLEYDNGTWSAGALLRLVDDQDRVAVNQGNVVGQDLGETDGFAVLSLNGGWRIRRGVQLTAGIDNLLDETYAEHVSRGGAMLAGYTQTERVNEPGRTAWMTS